MSKRIFISEDFKQECILDFKEMLDKMKVSDGKVTFSKVLTYTNRSAKVFFDLVAWSKMKALIKSFSTEVAWHGVAERLGDEGNDEYIIRDILVYPQVVTGAHVDTDQAEYQDWLIKLPDEQFNHMRMQGHSHVNMATNPSGVDLSNQSNILANLKPDDFYIFMIWNKKGESNVSIYDYKKNVLFENGDVSVGLYDPSGTDIDAFVSGAKEIVKEQKFTENKNGSYGYNGKQYGSPAGGRPRLKPSDIETKSAGKEDKKYSKPSYGSSYDYDDENGWYDAYGNFHYYGEFYKRHGD